MGGEIKYIYKNTVKVDYHEYIIVELRHKPKAFKRFLKAVKVGADTTFSGSLFQTRGTL